MNGGPGRFAAGAAPRDGGATAAASPRRGAPTSLPSTAFLCVSQAIGPPDAGAPPDFGALRATAAAGGGGAAAAVGTLAAAASNWEDPAYWRRSADAAA